MASPATIPPPAIDATSLYPVADILLGWAYALVALWAVNRVADALQRRAAARKQPVQA